MCVCVVVGPSDQGRSSLAHRALQASTAVPRTGRDHRFVNSAASGRRARRGKPAGGSSDELAGRPARVAAARACGCAAHGCAAAAA